MALKPFPLTVDPDDVSSPAGAFPVSIYGVPVADLTPYAKKTDIPDPELPELPPEDETLYVLTVKDGVLAWVEATSL